MCENTQSSSWALSRRNKKIRSTSSGSQVEHFERDVSKEASDASHSKPFDNKLRDSISLHGSKLKLAQSKAKVRRATFTEPNSWLRGCNFNPNIICRPSTLHPNWATSNVPKKEGCRHDVVTERDSQLRGCNFNPDSIRRCSKLHPKWAKMNSRGKG